jgi:hypothetical protein
MTVETPGLFAQVIQDHLELKRKNSTLDGDMPIDRYMSEDPFENHPLFKSEEQARIEETMDGSEPAIATEEISWPGVELQAEEVVEAHAFATAEESGEDSGLWSRSRDFDWGD